MLWPKLSEPEIDRKFVVSDAVVTLGYDPERRCLQVEYFSGHLYRIDGISAEKYRHLCDAKTFDHTFQHQICSCHKMTRIGSLRPAFR
ncbi:MAG: KTSC domain-containing protein [Sedimentitalea sp.]